MGKRFTPYIPYTPKTVFTVMSQKEKIREGAYFSGDLAQIDTIIDVEALIEKAGLTDRQKQVVENYYFNQNTQEETAEKLGISQQAVLDHLQKIKKKLSAVVLKWGEKDVVI